MHILIAEDEPAIRQELKLLLENALYQVTALEDFGDVAAEVLSIAPDLVLHFLWGAGCRTDQK